MITIDIQEYRARALMPIVGGWLVCCDKTVCKVTNEKIEPVYEDSYLIHTLQRTTITYFLIARRNFEKTYLDKYGNISETPTGLPCPKTEIFILSQSHIEIDILDFFKTHFRIQSEALLLRKEDKTKVLEMPKTFLASVSLDENTIAVAGENKILIIDNPL